jgi:hypothetical protein
MPYTDFDLALAETAFGLTARPGDLFAGLSPLHVPAWLQDLLEGGRRVAATALLDLGITPAAPGT